jgi:hypothetical protein
MTETAEILHFRQSPRFGTLSEGGVMIRDDDDLELVRGQLRRAERALASLRKDITNERNFALFSEAYVDQINALKVEMEAYAKTSKKNAKSNGKGRNRGRKAS